MFQFNLEFLQTFSSLKPGLLYLWFEQHWALLLLKNNLSTCGSTYSPGGPSDEDDGEDKPEQVAKHDDLQHIQVGPGGQWWNQSVSSI